MTTVDTRPPVAPGERAPDFTLPAVDRPETISLADYRGHSPLFLALFIGLWCPFCRRQIAQMTGLESQLKALGVQSLAVVATTPETRGSISSSARPGYGSPPIPSSRFIARTACRSLHRRPS